MDRMDSDEGDKDVEIIRDLEPFDWGKVLERDAPATFRQIVTRGILFDLVVLVDVVGEDELEVVEA